MISLSLSVVLELLLQHDPEHGHRELLLQSSQLAQELVRLVSSLSCTVKLSNREHRAIPLFSIISTIFSSKLGNSREQFSSLKRIFPSQNVSGAVDYLSEPV